MSVSAFQSNKAANIMPSHASCKYLILHRDEKVNFYFVSRVEELLIVGVFPVPISLEVTYLVCGTYFVWIESGTFISESQTDLIRTNKFELNCVNH